MIYEYISYWIGPGVRPCALHWHGGKYVRVIGTEYKNNKKCYRRSCTDPYSWSGWRNIAQPRWLSVCRRSAGLLRPSRRSWDAVANCCWERTTAVPRSLSVARSWRCYRCPTPVPASPLRNRTTRWAWNLLILPLIRQPSNGSTIMFKCHYFGDNRRKTKFTNNTVHTRTPLTTKS